MLSHQVVSQPLVSGQNMTVILPDRTVESVSLAAQISHAQPVDALHQLIPSSKQHSEPQMAMIGMILLKSMDGLYHITWSSPAEAKLILLTAQACHLLSAHLKTSTLLELLT